MTTQQPLHPHFDPVLESCKGNYPVRGPEEVGRICGHLMTHAFALLSALLLLDERDAIIRVKLFEPDLGLEGAVAACGAEEAAILICHHPETALHPSAADRRNVRVLSRKTRLTGLYMAAEETCIPYPLHKLLES